MTKTKESDPGQVRRERGGKEKVQTQPPKLVTCLGGSEEEKGKEVRSVKETFRVDMPDAGKQDGLKT